jgi:hypothetical protein
MHEYFKTDDDEEEPDDRLFLATSTCKYRFRCDGTFTMLIKNVSPLGLTEAQLEELLKFHRIKEVK